MNNPTIGRWAPLGLLLAFTLASKAQWFDQGPVFSLTEENDTLTRTDRHYTQGFKLSYLHTDNAIPVWLRKLSEAIPAWGFDPRATRIGTQVGQNIYTPTDLKASQLVTNDRPYAGWLYTGFILQRRGLTSNDRPTLESFQMDIGVVGPESLAEEAQDWAHSLEIQGWHNQLNTEFGLSLKYYRAWLFTQKRSGPRKFDFIPHAGISLGNIDTSFRAGGTLRLGINLPDDFGVQTINSLATSEGGMSRREGGRWGIYTFADAEGSAVAYNEFIDGTLYRDSQHVKHEPLVAELKCGLVLVSPHADVGATFAWRSDEFTTQSSWDVYGSLYVKVKL